MKEISPRNIVYRRWDNQDGADYIITRNEVSRIVYQNGTEEKMERRSGRQSPFNRDRDRDATTRDNGQTNGRRESGMEAGYGKNILAIAPLQMTNETVAGVGIHYERILDKGGIFAICLPVAFSFFDETVTNIISSAQPMTASRVFTYLYPGAKIYPGGSGHRVSYSVGPTFGLGFGTKYKMARIVEPGTGYIRYIYNDASIFKAGFMVNNGLNIQPTKQLYVGLEFGIGIMYYNNEGSDYAVGDEPMVQFNFKMGYRF